MRPSILDRFQSFVNAFSVPGLIRYVALLNALVFVLHLVAPGYTEMLELNPSLVLGGQVWRLVTWIFIPETLSPFWIIFAVLFLFYLGDGLETAMGPARLTIFYSCGVVLSTVATFVFSWAGATGASLAHANTFLNLSLLLAYATIYPDFKVLVFFVLPVRIVWLAIFSAVLMTLSAVGQPPVVAATLGAAFINYLLFFSAELRHRFSFLNSASLGKKAAVDTRGALSNGGVSLHCCNLCGRTEMSHTDLEFRVASDGEEYCWEHRPKGPIGLS